MPSMQNETKESHTVDQFDVDLVFHAQREFKKKERKEKKKERKKAE